MVAILIRMKTQEKTVWKKKPRCPKCRNNDRVRTHSGGILRVFFRWFNRYPFRCESCGGKFYRKWRYSTTPPVYYDD